MQSSAASIVDQEEVHWIQVPTALAAEIPRIGGALQLVVYLQVSMHNDETFKTG